jgi:hypothetical protein
MRAGCPVEDIIRNREICDGKARASWRDAIPKNCPRRGVFEARGLRVERIFAWWDRMGWSFPLRYAFLSRAVRKCKQRASKKEK